MALNRLDGMTAKIESTYATDSVPVIATDGVLVDERLWSPTNPTHAFENTREDAASGTLFSLFPAVPRGRIVEFDITWDARGSGAVYSATVLPEADPLLRACGLLRTDDFTVALENVSYAPRDTGHESCTIYVHAGGNLYRIVGCRGVLRIPISAGGQSRFVFSMSGIMLTDPVTFVFPSITYDSPIAPPSVNMALTVGAWSPDSFTFQLAGGQDIQRLDSVNAAEGVAEFAIVGFDPIITVNARTTVLATYNPYADLRARTSRAIAIAAGTVQYNKWDLAVVAAYVRDPSHSVDNGVVAWDLEYILQDYALKFN